MIHQALQRVFLWLYKLVAWTGILRNPLARELMLRAYELYKSQFEASYIGSLKAFVRPNSIVIDVGANVGFFTRFFGEWVKETGYVIAIEPESENLLRLARQIERYNLGNWVKVLPVGAAAENGQAMLVLDGDNPANHKIGAQGVKIDVISLDSLLKSHTLDISFIKIDVQGAELLVLQGAVKIIERFHPSFIVEIHEPSLADFNVKAEDVLSFLTNLGYSMHLLEKGRLSAPLNVSDILNKDASYSDVIFIWH
jgi:FkbM family methyltransferase